MHKNDIQINMVFGELTTVKEDTVRLRNEVAWICKCSCGEETKATRGQLVKGTKKSCGCLRKKSPKNVLDLANQRFGMLVALERAGKTINDNALWLCKCDCGGHTNANATSLSKGDVVSCGCQRPTQMKKARDVLTNEKSVDGVLVPNLKSSVRIDSKSGHKGVAYRQRKGKEYYEVNLSIKGKRYFAGPFKKITDAIDARKQLEEKYHAPYIKALEVRENGQRSN
ncbi:hypothetical protein [Paenibacillus sp. L3-i20]|uniref:hypothetical protein n=1 Tax=Paenibacillus sp. L3-i20 TaxID=2905833 RepID=UPI001EDE3A79|nr:hypothetical protein [Paenibacillus sp. L3-i20]GKU79837.1 AP2 domain-containing protein [Paenibacillus sp. L3-i20]